MIHSVVLLGHLLTNKQLWISIVNGQEIGIQQSQKI